MTGCKCKERLGVEVSVIGLSSMSSKDRPGYFDLIGGGLRVGEYSFDP